MNPSISRRAIHDFAIHDFAVRDFDGVLANDLRPTAQVMPLALADGRRPRREGMPSDEHLGQILLFTGVRYERMPDLDVTEAAPALPQRRHS